MDWELAGRWALILIAVEIAAEIFIKILKKIREN